MKSLFSILHVSEEALVLSLFALNGYTWIQEYKEFGTGEVPSKNERETEDADGGEPKKKRGRKMGYFKNYLGTNNGIRVYTDFMKRLMHVGSEEKSIVDTGDNEVQFPQIGWYHLALDNIDDLFKKTMNDEVTTEESTESEDTVVHDDPMSLVIPFCEV